MIEQILIQAAYYFIAMVLGIFFITIIQRGIFWPLVLARLSFGKLIVVKIRSVHRDYFKLGKIEDGFLVFGKKPLQKRISIPSNEFFYRVSGLIWVDLDEETGALCKPDYSVVSGFDPVKYNNLYIRTLFQPAVANNQDKIIIGCLILIVVCVAVVGFLVYKNGYSLNFIVERIGQIAASSRPTITPP